MLYFNENSVNSHAANAYFINSHQNLLLPFKTLLQLPKQKRRPMKVDKYDVTAQSGAYIWVIVEHGTNMETFETPEGYSIKEFIETFELSDAADINYDLAMDRLKVKGCFYGTTFKGCSTKK